MAGGYRGGHHGNGCAGLLVAHFLLLWRPFPLFYGVVSVRSASAPLNLVLPEAFAFLAASVWLLSVTGGPGGGAVRRAVQQLRGAGSEQDGEGGRAPATGNRPNVLSGIYG